MDNDIGMGPFLLYLKLFFQLAPTLANLKCRVHELYVPRTVLRAYAPQVITSLFAHNPRIGKESHHLVPKPPRLLPAVASKRSQLALGADPIETLGEVEFHQYKDNNLL